MNNNTQVIASADLPAAVDPLVLPQRLLGRVQEQIAADVAHMQAAGEERVRQLEEEAAAIRAEAERRIAELAGEAERARAQVAADVASLEGFGAELVRRAQAGVRS